MGFIDKTQYLVLEIIGLVLMVVGFLGLLNLVFDFIPFISKGLGFWAYLILLVVGLICAGYIAIPRRIARTIGALRG